MVADNVSETDEFHSWTAIVLVALSVLGAGIGYVTSVAAARILGAAAFENYVVTVASMGLLATLAEAGVGKYALKAMPAYRVSHHWGLASGYCRFSLFVTLLISVSLSVIVFTYEATSQRDVWEHPLRIAVVFLPAVALAGVGVDFIMANLAPVRGALIARLLVPGTTLLLLITAGFWAREVNAGTAMICFGIGSFVGAIACAAIYRTTSQRSVLSSEPKYRPAEWLRGCGYFAAISFLMSWIFRISVVILELLPVAESQVGYFAAAMETGCLVLLMSKSTDKLFQPEMSTILEGENWGYADRFRIRRFRLIGSSCLGFMLVIVYFGRPILGLYGPEFRAGYPALCYIAFGSCVWTVFSLASAYLRFVGRNQFVLVVTVVAAVMMALLTAVLGTRLGATGAGLAFCIVMCGASLVFYTVGKRHLRMQSHSARGDAIG